MLNPFKKVLYSKVPGYEGLCYPSRLNRNAVYNRLDGGVTGFFKQSLFGEEFHGIIHNGAVYSTAFFDDESKQQYSYHSNTVIDPTRHEIYVNGKLLKQ